MEQITLSFERGLVEAYPTCREYIASLVHQQGRPQKAIAADMDYSPSHLSRKLAQSPDDSMRFTLDDLEAFMNTNDETRPVLYLIEKYLAGDRSRIQKLEEELARLKRTQS